MGFREVQTGAIDIKNDEDTPYTGVYQGFKEISTQYGEQFIYKFVNSETNQSFSLYGFTLLNRAMENVQEGLLCRITYTGMKNMKTKRFPNGKDIHTCRVEVDDSVPETDINADVEVPPDEESDVEPF